jgi:hypothetical protein
VFRSFFILAGLFLPANGSIHTPSASTSSSSSDFIGRIEKVHALDIAHTLSILMGTTLFLFVQILDPELQSPGIVECVAEHTVAVDTQQTSDLIGVVVVIDEQVLLEVVATCTATFLLLDQSHVVIESYPVACLQVFLSVLCRLERRVSAGSAK